MSIFAERIINALEMGEKRGENVHLDFSFTRHETPDKAPDGMSLDKIKPEGLEKAKQAGKEEGADQSILVFGSAGAKRARETGQAYAQGVTEENWSEVVNKIGKDSKAAEFGVYVSEDINPMHNVGVLLKPILAKGKEMVARGEMGSGELEGWAIARLLEISEGEFNEKGVESPREVAARMARRLNLGIKMSEKLVKDVDTKVNNFSHGPNLECLLKFIIKNGEKTGFDTVDEIGGAFKPGDHIDFSIDRDDNGNLKDLKVSFRGKTYEVDVEAVNELVELYKQKNDSV